MSEFIRDKTAIAGIGLSKFGRGLEESQLELGNIFVRVGSHRNFEAA